MTKPCSTCKEVKPLLDFGKSTQTASGYRYSCRDCSNTKTRERKAKHPGVRAIATQGIRLTSLGRAMYLVLGAKNRAAQNSIEFKLTKEWVAVKIEKGFCEVTGVPFDLTPDGRGKGYKRSFGPSLDRSDPMKGYTPENTKVVVWAYNGAKGSGTHEEVLQMARSMCNVK